MEKSARKTSMAQGCVRLNKRVAFIPIEKKIKKSGIFIMSLSKNGGGVAKFI